MLEITVRGILDERWQDWFPGVTLREGARAELTVLVGDLDQAALHGVLQQLTDLGVPLVSVRELDPDDQPGSRRSRNSTSEKREKVP